jgi:hypothetical protein
VYRAPSNVRLPDLWAKIQRLERELEAVKTAEAVKRTNKSAVDTDRDSSVDGTAISEESNDASFPVSETVDALVSLYKHEIGPILYHESFPGTEGFDEYEPSELVRMSMACLASRYMSQDTAAGLRIYERVRKALEPTLAGTVPPTEEVLHALFLLVNFLCFSNDLTVSHVYLSSNPASTF